MSVPATFAQDLGNGPVLKKEDWPNTDHLITEDNESEDGIYSERQMRLLVDALYTSWSPGRPFVACCNVGVFYINQNPAIVPDVFVSLDVELHNDTSTAAGRSYLLWDKGKPPDVVIEVVSNTVGNELTSKRKTYAQNVRAPYYVVWDPEEHLGSDPLHLFVLKGLEYHPTDSLWIPVLDLGLTRWTGTFEGMEAEWLRWCDADGRVLPNGEEQRHRADAAVQEADLAWKHAAAAKSEATEARSEAAAEKRRADLLAAKLRELNIDPSTLME